MLQANQIFRPAENLNFKPENRYGSKIRLRKDKNKYVVAIKLQILNIKNH